MGRYFLLTALFKTCVTGINHEKSGKENLDNFSELLFQKNPQLRKQCRNCGHQNHSYRTS